MPNRIKSRRTASELLEGPAVQTILAFREVVFSRPMGRFLKFLPSSPLFSVRGFRINLSVKFRAQQHNNRKNIEPYQQRNTGTQRSINHTVVCVIGHIPAKEHGRRKPEEGR